VAADLELLRRVIWILGGTGVVGRELGVTTVSVQRWVKGQRRISGEHARRLHELLVGRSGELPGLAQAMLALGREADKRRLDEWAAARARALVQFGQLWPTRGGKPRISPEERRERRWRNMEIARRRAAGVGVEELALWFGVQPGTIRVWIRRGQREEARRERRRKAKASAVVAGAAAADNHIIGETNSGEPQNPV
jgi:hypothetical protein